MSDSAENRGGRSPAALRRRQFLGATGLATAGAAFTSVGAQALAAGEPAPEPDPDPHRLEYRETDHIRAFYRRARM